MRSTPAARRSDSIFLPGKLFLIVACLVLLGTGAYFYQVAMARYTHFDAAHYGHHWLTRWWLVTHLFGGSLALVLGPVQFNDTVRRKYGNVHRWVGRTYLFGVFIGSITAVYMSLFVAPSRAFGVSLLFLAVAWLTTSVMGLVAALCKQFVVHREWMIRSYVVTFGFVVFRLLGDLHAFSRLSNEGDAVTRGWFCWAVPLLVTEVVLQWKTTVGLKPQLNRQVTRS